MVRMASESLSERSKVLGALDKAATEIDHLQHEKTKEV
jgi:hypothetical protein